MLQIAAENQKRITMDWSSGWYVYAFFGNTGLEVGLNDDGITNYCTWNKTDGDVKGVDVANAMLAIASSPAFLSTEESGFLAGIKDGVLAARFALGGKRNIEICLCFVFFLKTFNNLP